jgi:C-terminal processing protease CtpA/Prc
MVAIGLAVAFAPASAPAQPANCSTVSQNLYVRDLFWKMYYWYKFIPDLEPARYDSPEEYLEAIRYRPLDQSFSHISPRAATDAFYSESQYIGFGFSTRLVSIDAGAALEMWVSQVYPDTPAAAAGLKRGDRILSAGGRTVTDWWLAGEIDQTFGPPKIGYETTTVYQRRNAEPVEAAMTKGAVTIPTVSATQVYEVDGIRVGYVFFRNFVEPSVAALDEAFAQLGRAGVRELVLDMRYNGGGLVSVAQHLASLIGGARTSGLVLGEPSYSDKNTFRNRPIRFEEKAHALTLDRLFVITSRATASASELIINGLRPHLPVVLVGDRTYGKPVGQDVFNFCDKSVFPVTFVIRNANGEADYFDGIPATCPAADDLSRQLGDSEEPSLAEALRFVRTGACSPSVAPSSLRARGVPIAPPESGLQQLIGAW